MVFLRGNFSRDIRFISILRCDSLPGRIHHPRKISACWAQNRRTSPNSLLAKIPRNRNEPWGGTILLIHTYTPPRSRPSSFPIFLRDFSLLSAAPLSFFRIRCSPSLDVARVCSIVVGSCKRASSSSSLYFFCCCYHSLFCASLITLRPGPSPTLFFSFAPRLLVPPPLPPVLGLLLVSHHRKPDRTHSAALSRCR